MKVMEMEEVRSQISSRSDRDTERAMIEIGSKRNVHQRGGNGTDGE